MRRIAALIIALSLLAGAHSALLAQSGRKVTPASTGGAKTNSSVSSGPAATTGESSEDIVERGESNNGEGETVEDDVVRVSTNLVTVPVSVRDPNGRYVPNLRRQDFQLFEEGVPQRIAYFATVDQPFTVVLLLDTSGSTEIKLEDIQSAAISFVDQLRPADRVMVVSFDDNITVQSQPTSDHQALTRAIRRTRTGGSTRLYDAVDQVIKKHLKGIEGRKAVVIFTDGVDTASMRASYQSTIREAEELDALIYPVSYNTYDDMNGTMGQNWPMPGSGGRNTGGGRIFGIPIPVPNAGGGVLGGGPTIADFRLGNRYLHELADKTGGRFYSGDSLYNISAAFAGVAEELRRQYSLGYYPKQSGPEGLRRRIKVRVNQQGLVVVARSSYIYSQKKKDATSNLIGGERE